MSDPVSVSVIVPVRNGAEYIRPFCRAMERQTSRDYELIVVDNGSADGAGQMLHECADLPLTVLEWRMTASSYGARHAGVGHATAGILAFTDIDCLPEPDWIHNIISRKTTLLQDVILAGEIRLFLPSSPVAVDGQVPQEYSGTEENEPQRWNPVAAYDRSVHLQQQAYARQGLAVTANLVVSRSLYERCGGFAPAVSGEDHAFCRRAVGGGAVIKFCPEVCVFHPVRSSLSACLAKEWRIGKGKGMRLAQYPVHRLTMVLLKNMIALCVQPMQWKLIIHAFSAGKLRYLQVLSMAVVAVCCGVAGRFSVMLHAVAAKTCGGERHG